MEDFIKAEYFLNVVVCGSNIKIPSKVVKIFINTKDGLIIEKYLCIANVRRFSVCL